MLERKDCRQLNSLHLRILLTISRNMRKIGLFQNNYLPFKLTDKRRNHTFSFSRKKGMITGNSNIIWDIQNCLYNKIQKFSGIFGTIDISWIVKTSSKWNFLLFFSGSGCPVSELRTAAIPDWSILFKYGRADIPRNHWDSRILGTPWDGSSQMAALEERHHRTVWVGRSGDGNHYELARVLSLAVIYFTKTVA